MTKNVEESVEAKDADTVNQALEELMAGDIEACEPKLLEVAARTPADYRNEVDLGEETRVIKFWDQSSFIHYVMWQKQHGTEQSLQWAGNAYPRAHYYLGFLSVRRKEFDRAMAFLERGLELEPTNPKFVLEKGQACVQAGRHADALAEYAKVREVGPYVSPRDVAVAMRGRGFILIELGALDAAEEAFRSSLTLDRDSEVARNELKYIAHLKEGGTPVNSGSVVTRPEETLNVCVVCEKSFEEGVLIPAEGELLSICKRCHGRLTKKWWQFWK